MLDGVRDQRLSNVALPQKLLLTGVHGSSPWQVVTLARIRLSQRTRDVDGSVSLSIHFHGQSSTASIYFGDKRLAGVLRCDTTMTEQ